MDQRILSVSELNGYIKYTFEQDAILKNVWVQGEISNCKKHSSGHFYFTLKDAESQLSCVLFKSYADRLGFPIKDGMKIIAKGAITVYESRGQYQLYAREIVEDGLGKLYQKFAYLKEKLANEGLFDESIKKDIPKFSKKIGIVTSNTGAAIHDMIQIAKRRNPYVQLVLYPSLVQGPSAAQQIVQGIGFLDAREDIDLIIIGRGGGSLEDLWPFNEEIVARAIYRASKPIISAVGHETDFTIADFVADLRAATPSAAIELTVFPYVDFQRQLEHLNFRLFQSESNFVTKRKQQVVQLAQSLERFNPRVRIEQRFQKIVDLEMRLQNAQERYLNQKQHQMHILLEKLNGHSPMKRMSEGFSYVSDTQGHGIKSVKEIQAKDMLKIHMADGQLDVIVKKIYDTQLEEIHES